MIRILRRSLSGAASGRRKQICVVGAGPAGLYTVDSLLRRGPLDGIEVTVLERLPVPYGLVRFGVAPDHPEVKLVENKFSDLLKDPRVKFYGNVNVGTDISAKELLSTFDAVVLAYGAQGSRKLGIPGEHMRNVVSARDFVGWYNSHPDNADVNLHSTHSQSALVIGIGNVALDVARTLLRTPEELAMTDISTNALEQLRMYRTRRVHVVGRRGLHEAQWTAKEVREALYGLRATHVEIQEQDVSLNQKQLAELSKDRPRSRSYNLFARRFEEEQYDYPQKDKRTLSFRFGMTPLQILGDEGRVTGVELAPSPVVKRCEEAGKPVPRTKKVTVNVGLVVTCIGYRNEAMEGVPFSYDSNLVPNSRGRVDGVPNLFVTGWIKRGPTGIIATNKWDAEETAETMLETMYADGAGAKSPGPGRDGLERLLKERSVSWVSSEGWSAIDAEETRQGSAIGRPRIKIGDWDSLLECGRAGTWSNSDAAGEESA